MSNTRCVIQPFGKCTSYSVLISSNYFIYKYKYFYIKIGGLKGVNW
jgi:hypothetical protein